MDASVKDSNDKLSDLADGVGAAIKFIVEKGMHCFDAILESGLDCLNALFDALSLLWDLPQCSQDFSWHGEVVDLCVVWSATLSVMIVDQWCDELNELFEVCLELDKVLANLRKLATGLASNLSGAI